MRIALTRIRPRRSLTWFGRAVISTIFFLLCVAFFPTLYPALAPNAPPHHGILVIEGWIDDQSLASARAIYEAGNYSHIASTGVQIDIGSHLVAYKTYADMTTARLIELGLSPDEIITASEMSAQRDRTYAAAIALKQQLTALQLDEKNIHLLTVGPHGRRSRLLYQKALGPNYTIGITCLEDPTYNAANWWHSSNGVRTVISESIAYLYALLFFHP